MGRFVLVRVLIVAIVCTPLPCAAQSPLPIAVDQRVRLWTDAADAIVGRVATVTPQFVQIAVAEGDPITVTRPAVRRIEVSQGRALRGAAFRRGAIRGALILGAILAVSGALQHEQVGDGATAAEAAALGLWSGGLFGGLIGGGISAARRGDVWQQVWP